MTEFAEVINFTADNHICYIKKVANDKDSFEFIVTEHLRMSGVYWALMPLCLMGKSLHDELDINEIVNWVLECQDKECAG